MSTSSGNDDHLLSRLQRSLIEARNINMVDADDHRRALVLTVEIRNHIQLLTEQLRLIEGEMRSVVHRAGAMNAYRKVANYTGRSINGRGKGVN